ncbi:hypothetical protein [Deinococcus aestuarii]|uniref:hypothetical protein n=1 Tax=Deinococcus aestuarii TaxID=2774531 RepID=UPI001C0C0B5D|nr:hypothetical protein [Deinococcus aestuarii]
MDVSPEQFERMAKATLAAYATRLGPSLDLTMETGPEGVRFVLRRQTTPSAETYGAAAVVAKPAVDADGVEPFQQVLDHLLDLNERGALPPLPDGDEPPTVCEYRAGEGLRALS